MEALPEEEQAHQNEAIRACDPAIQGKSPERAAEKNRRRQGQEKRKPRPLLFSVRLLLSWFSTPRLRRDAQSPEQSWQSEQQRHVGDIIDN
jgi:hypothetical protein